MTEREREKERKGIEKALQRVERCKSNQILKKDGISPDRLKHGGGQPKGDIKDV